MEQAQELLKVREDLIAQKREDEVLKSQIVQERKKMESALEHVSMESRIKESELKAALSEKDRQLARQASCEKDTFSAVAVKEFQDLKGEIARLTSSLSQLQASVRSSDGF